MQKNNDGIAVISKSRGLTGSEIKLIAILAMLVDHIAWAFVPIDTFKGQLMHFFGRMTAPTMAFFISEGFHYTRNLRKYFLRLGVFAVISQMAFGYYNQEGLFWIGKLSVITTLLLGLTAVWVYNTDKLPKSLKLPALMLIMIVSEKCDWGGSLMWFILAFEVARGNKKEQIIAYGCTAFALKLVPFIYRTIDHPETISFSWMILGVMLPLILLAMYNGEKGGGKYSKWVFYVFYPLHLFIIGYISERFG